MTPDETRLDGIRSYSLAIEAARADYLANRLPGETAAQYVERRRGDGRVNPFAAMNEE